MKQSRQHAQQNCGWNYWRYWGIGLGIAVPVVLLTGLAIVLWLALQ